MSLARMLAPARLLMVLAVMSSRRAALSVASFTRLPPTRRLKSPLLTRSAAGAMGVVAAQRQIQQVLRQDAAAAVEADGVD